MWGQFKDDRILCSCCRASECRRSADLTARISRELLEVAMDTAAEEPWPIIGPLVHFMREKRRGGGVLFLAK